MRVHAQIDAQFKNKEAEAKKKKKADKKAAKEASAESGAKVQHAWPTPTSCLTPTPGLLPRRPLKLHTSNKKQHCSLLKLLWSASTLMRMPPVQTRPRWQPR